MAIHHALCAIFSLRSLFIAAPSLSLLGTYRLLHGRQNIRGLNFIPGCRLVTGINHDDSTFHRVDDLMKLSDVDIGDVDTDAHGDHTKIRYALPAGQIVIQRTIY